MRFKYIAASVIIMALMASGLVAFNWPYMQQFHIKAIVENTLGINQHEKKQKAARYKRLIEGIDERRKGFRAEYLRAAPVEKKQVLDRSREYLFQVMKDEIVPLWIGTEYDFNGASQSPQVGQIACGYLVSTIVQQMGFNINRIKMAQKASLTGIRSLSPNGNRFAINPSDSPVEDLKQKLKQMGKGLYILGLDNHTGFAIYDNTGFHFFHTGFLHVVKEPVDRSFSLRYATTKGIHGGRLFSDWMMEHWMKGEPVKLL